MKNDKNIVKDIAELLVIIGGLNWGLVGIINFDLVNWIGGLTLPLLAQIIYILVGLSALYMLVEWVQKLSK